MRLALAIACLASPALADVDAALESHVLPGVDTFAAKTMKLAEAADEDCTAAALRPPYQEAFDAWMGISHLRFGPLEVDGRALAIGFWPDSRGMVPRTVARLIAEEDSAAGDPEAFAEVSVAGRGLFALERLLYDEDLSGYSADDYTCELASAISSDLSRMAQDLQTDWDAHARVMRSAGAEDNSTYLSQKEAAQTLYTALMTGLEFTKDQRLGRPLGTFDRPRPNWAEAYRSDRPLRNIVLSLEALHDLARALPEAPIPITEAAFADALQVAAELDDPRLAGVEDPADRLKVEILQQRIDLLQDAVAGEIGGALGLTQGFNAQDGD